MSDQTGESKDSPLFSIVTPVYNTPLDVLAEMIESVQAQTVDDWELILVDDCSPDPDVVALMRRYAAADARIRLIERAENGHIVAASNDGIDAARGAFIALLDHDDLLTSDALERNAEAIAEFDDVDYLYSDEDKVDADGRFFDTFPKPTWSPHRLRGHMYTGHLSVIRTSLVRELGGFRSGYDGSQDHELTLRVVEQARRIVHIPHVLYHWRLVEGSAAADPDAKPYASNAGRQAVQDQLDRLGVAADTEPTEYGPVYGVRWRERPDISASIIISSVGSTSILHGTLRTHVVEAVRSAVRERPDRELEIVVVHTEPFAVADELRQLAGHRLRLIGVGEHTAPGARLNIGAAQSHGDHLVFLDESVETREPGWLTQLLGPLADPAVGVTGAKVHAPDASLVHVGMAYLRGRYRHVDLGAPGNWPGHIAAHLVTHEVSAVAGAALAVRRETFWNVGGFSERLTQQFTDVDLCLKVGRLGLSTVFVATAKLTRHTEPLDPADADPGDRDFMLLRWGRLDRDPYLA